MRACRYEDFNVFIRDYNSPFEMPERLKQALAAGNTCIALSECRLAGNKWAALHCGASANLVTWCLDTCRITARSGFVWLTNRRPAILRTRRLQVLTRVLAFVVSDDMRHTCDALHSIIDRHICASLHR